ncbi:carbohydrate ABC transporter permease [Lacrimispora sp. 210928-DFI.3.58]|uniref:carbohydrate ABC transporter permease n=1 Tax=Lacrimispora sp. 210928-DFI.3.58 TaxID=2883214 RepID=UPI001D0830EC|nr:sugar ABC transporter permease [Lacrimispora sp. 210928-DFI.3.58]MCB7317481.1 sugar ABC transporter permease [Lacrimispora sp. 210928-DFI.3.58]
MNRLSKKRLYFLSLSLIIPVILLCIFVVYPFWELIHMSFQDWDGVASVRTFIGSENYRQLFFQSPEFWQAFRNNLTYLIIHGIMMPIELALAVLLSSRFKGSSFVKAVIFLPFIINGVGISYSFSYFFSPVEGGFNYILTKLGMEGLIRSWLSDPKILNYVLASVSIWRYMGFHIVLFMAGLASVPKDMLEAAIVDGAGVWQRLRYIQVPAIRTVIDFMLFDVINGSLQMFDIPYIMTAGGPSGASNTFSIYTIDTAFKYNNFGMASSMAVVMIAMIVAVQLVQRFITGRVRRKEGNA